MPTRTIDPDTPRIPAAVMRRRGTVHDLAMISAAVVLTVFILVAGAWTWKLDLALYDAGLMLSRQPPRDDVVIVAIDDATVGQTGIRPWRREQVAAILDRIALAAPRAVGIDMLFPAPDPLNPEGDRLLAAAIQRTPGPVLPVISGQGIKLPPLTIFASKATLADSSIKPDTDGVTRCVMLNTAFEGGSLPHMGLAMMQAAGMALPQHPSNDFLIPYSGPPGHLPRISAADLLAGRVPAATLAGNFVLVGVTAGDYSEGVATPGFGAGERMTRTEVAGHVLASLLDGRRIERAGPLAVALWSAAAMNLLLLAFYRVGTRAALGLMLATVICIPVAAVVVLVVAGYWFPPMTAAIAAMIAYPLWSWKRLDATCRSLDEEILRLENDHPEAVKPLPSALIGFADYIQSRIEMIRLNVHYLRAARKFLGESLDGLPYAALVVAPDARIVVANQQALALCAMDRKMISHCLVGVALSHVVPEGKGWREAVAEALAGAALDLHARDADGREYEVTLASFRNDQSEISGLIVVVEDVTALRQAQREREDMLSFLSHDIRSPQNSILALAELQRHQSTRKPEDEFVAAVESLARGTMGLAEGFLQLARAEAKPLDMVEQDLSTLVEDCVAEIEPQARGRRIGIRTDTNGGAIPVMADRSLLARAIGNLLGNAVKYSPPGGQVIVQCGREQGEAVCRIIDSGPGIPAQEVPRLFKRFSRVRADENKVTGIGLGLAFVDVAVRRHGGRIRVDSGSGACFTLSLPLLATDSPMAEM